MSGAGLREDACEMRSKVEIAIKLGVGRDDGARTFLQVACTCSREAFAGCFNAMPFTTGSSSGRVFSAPSILRLRRAFRYCMSFSFTAASPYAA